MAPLLINGHRRQSRHRNTALRSRRALLEELEPRIVLAPMISDGIVTATDLSDIFSIRQVTDEVTGRLEIAPVSFAGGDTFVVERLGPDPDGDGIVNRPGAPEPGTISRVTRSGQVSFFASVPGGELGFGGYTNFFDIVFDPIGIFDGVPSMFVSTSSQVESFATPMMENAIYRFDANGNLLDDGPFAVFTEDSDGDLTYDDHPTVMAIAPPGSEFGPGLYVADVEEETQNEHDDLFIFSSSYTPGAVINGGPLPAGVQQITDLGGRVLPAGPLVDVDLRSIVFDPGNIYDGTLIAQSTDLEDGTASTIVKYDPPLLSSGAPFTTTLFEPLAAHHWTDATFDPTGFFSTDDTGALIGSYFAADNAGGGDPNLRGVIHRIGPGGNFNNGGDLDPFAYNFNVGVTDLAIDPVGGLDRAFSLSFSADGQRLQVADLDGIWEIRSDIGLPCSDAGRLTGVCDVLVDLGRPYLGAGTAVAVIDSGVDATHSGFGGLVTEGVAVAGGSPTEGAFDEVGHGTSVAGIIHQIAPEAVIVPVKIDIPGTGGASNRQLIWESIKWVADNPVVLHPLTGEPVPIIAGNMSIGLINSELVYDSEVEAAELDPTSLFTYKDQFQRWAALGILPAAAAGNEGLFFEAAMDAIDMPGVINEVISVAASYPYGPAPTVPPPAGCALEGGDLIGFADKVAAFASRNQDTDFLAPGTCIRTFNPVEIGASPSGLPPIELAFNGSSASTPFALGISVLVQSAVNFWADAAAAASSTAGFLGGTPASPVALPGIPNLRGYLSPDGINAILQWTATPHEDVNLDPPLASGLPRVEDQVDQQGRLIVSGTGQLVDSTSDYRVYSRVDAAAAVSAIEGTIGFSYFAARPAMIGALDAISDGIVTAAEIQAFADDPANDATSRAMASLIGGTSSSALVDRTEFFDLLDGKNGLLEAKGIRISQFSTLANTLLPSLDKFHITERIENGNEGYLVNPNEVRNWHDLTLMLPSANFVDDIPDIYRGKGPSDLGGSTALTLKNMFPRDPDDYVEGQVPAPDDGTGDNTGGGDPGGGDDGTGGNTGGGGDPTGGGDSTGGGGGDPTGQQGMRNFPAVFRNGKWFIDTDGNGGAAERAFTFGITGDIPVAGDFNGDGQGDAAIFRNGVWHIDLDGKGGAAEKTVAFGSRGDIPVAGDFNDDGRTDMAIFRRGAWHIDLDGAGGGAEKVFAFGIGTDVPVSADFDDNGRSDAAIFRNGVWHIDLSGTGGAAERTFAFGVAGDTPVAGTWETSGPATAAVARQNLWFFDRDGKGGAAESHLLFGSRGDVAVAFLDVFAGGTESLQVPDQSGGTSGGDNTLPPPVNQPGDGSMDDGTGSGTGSDAPPPSGGSGGGQYLQSVSVTAQPVISGGSAIINSDAEQDVDRALEDLLQEWAPEKLLGLI